MKKSVENICLKFRGEKDKTEEKYIFKTTVGTLFVIDRNDDEFIPMMFDKDFNRETFLKFSHDTSVGEHSYKWNLHSSDKKFNLGRLEQRLDFINRYFM